jgi:putative ABC transport system permease protein
VFKLSLNSLWSHKRRLISTCISVLLGVAFMSGTLVLTSTINHVFDDLFAGTNQGTDAIVRGPIIVKDQRQGTQRSRIPASTVEKVRKVPGVVAAVPSTFTADLTLLSPGGDPLGGNGPPTVVTSWTTDRNLNDYRVAQGRAPQADGEAVIDTATAKASKFTLGKPITIVTAQGTKKLTLVGLTKFGDADSAGGLISIGTTLSQAQLVTGEPGRIDEVDVRAAPGVSPDQLVQRLKTAKVTAKADVLTGRQAANEQANEIKSAFGFFSKILQVFALIALFVGAFIISNTFSILVAQRTRELALLRAIGGSRGQVLGSVLLEAVAVGLISAVLGFATGVGLAVGALAGLKAAGVDLPTAGVTITPLSLAYAIGLGMLITLVAALLPARRATRVPPIAAMRDVAVEQSDRSVGRLVLGLIIAAGGVALSTTAFRTDPKLSLVGVGLGLIVLAVLVFGPIIAEPIARVVGAPLPLIKGLTGTLARQNATRNPRRTASTAAALIIGVTLVGFITIFAASAQTSVTSAIDGGFRGNYIVSPASQHGSVGAPPKLAASIRKVPGVEAVAATSYQGAILMLPDGSTPSVFVAGVDPAAYQSIFKVDMLQGRFTDLRKGGVIVDEEAARKQHISIGERIGLTSDKGRKVSLRVVAVAKRSVLLRNWTISKADAEALTHTPSDAVIGIKLTNGTSVDGVRPKLRKLVREYPTLKLQDRNQFTGSIVGQIKALLNVIYGLLALSIIIALIGIANTLSLSVYERTRELGLLRATGMSRRQLRSTVRWEAVIVALMGTVIGLVLSVVLSWILVKALKNEGVTDYSVPIGGMVFVVIFGAALGVLASVRPAIRAAKLNVLQAIASE